MIASLVEVEVRLLDSSSREQLVATLRESGITQAWLAEQSTDRLRLLLLAVRLLRMLRRQDEIRARAAPTNLENGKG